ncbi:MAG: PAS domain S-box protein [Alphaproteobacteria bacterium]|nr:PAS domain S-box protein [Alphaproteobacteria bacterium]
MRRQGGGRACGRQRRQRVHDPDRRRRLSGRLRSPQASARCAGGACHVAYHRHPLHLGGARAARPAPAWRVKVMDEVLLIGCPASFLAVLPDDVRPVRLDRWTNEEAGVLEPVLVIVGPSVDAPILAAQHAAQRYEGCGMVIAAPSERCAEIVRLLRVTPFVPMGTRVIAHDRRNELGEGFRQALERARLDAAQRLRLEQVQRALAAAGSVHAGSEGDGETSGQVHGVLLSAAEREELQAFFRLYDAHRREIGENILSEGWKAESPALAETEEEQTRRSEWDETCACLQRDAVLGDDWAPYLDRLRAEGEAYARRGRTFHRWLALLQGFRRRATTLLMEGTAGRGGESAALIGGMNLFLDLATETFMEAYTLARRGQYYGYSERERLYGSVVESSDDGIMSMSLDGIITGWNRAAERMYGFTAEQAIGTHIDIVVPEDRQEEVQDLRRRLAQGDSLTNFETVRVTRDGRRIDVALTLSPVRARSGAIIGASAIIRDITERNRKQRELDRQAQELEVARVDYQDLFDNAPDMYLLVDVRTRRISNCNETFIRKIGYARDEVLGRSIFDIYHPDFHGEIREAFGTLGKDGEVGNVRRGLQCRDGSVIPVLLSVTAAWDRQGEIEYSRCSLRDISDIVELEARQSAILAGALDAILTIDGDGIIVEYNPAAEILFGYDRSEAIGGSLADLIVPPDQREAHRNGLARYIGTGEARVLGRRLELSAVRKNGEEFPAEISIVKLSGTAQPLFTGFVRDLTELKKTQGELQRSIAELRRSNGDLEQFAYAASHDLQEPLRMVGSYMELLDGAYGKALDETARTYIRFAADGAERMKSLVDGLLDYSRVDTRGDNFSWEPCADILARALGDVQMLVDETGVEVTHGELPTIWIDPRQIERVFLNLLTNAIKFRGRTNPRVHVSADRNAEGEWQIVVEDNGIGFEEKNAERIFQMFQKLHGRGEYGGSGMGLALTKKIVERHGGRIWVESTPGVGSRFHFTIPAGSAAAAHFSRAAARRTSGEEGE